MEIISTLIPFIETETMATVCSWAFPLLPCEQKDDDDFMIQVHAVINFHHNSTYESLFDRWTTSKAFNFSRRAFIEATESKQRDIFSSILTKDLGLPFALEKQDLLWFNFSVWSSEGETMEGILMHLLQVARDDCLAPAKNGKSKMAIYIMKAVSDIRLADYGMLLHLNGIIEAKNHLLSDWFAKNLKDLVDLDARTSRRARNALFELYDASTRDNMLLGLKSVEVVKNEEESSSEEEGDEDCCVICLKEFRHGEIGIGMPCSHFFHGFCLLVWIARTMTCPICRFQLLNRSRLN